MPYVSKQSDGHYIPELTTYHNSARTPPRSTKWERRARIGLWNTASKNYLKIQYLTKIY